jgi:hypothetical protein
MVSDGGDDDDDGDDSNPQDRILSRGVTVQEYFGMNLLSVEWTCTADEPNKFVVESPKGLHGIASNCVMDFEFRDTSTKTTSTTEVQLTMEYTPESILAIVATPILVIDNWLALNVFLQAAMDPTPLHSFRHLLGTLYGLAGIGHFLDITIGKSQLFTQVGMPPYSELSSLGQVYALLWCAVGPFAYVLTHLPTRRNTTKSIHYGDVGITLYGLVEVLGAYLTQRPNVLINAVGVQLIVFGAWFYSFRKQRSKEHEQHQRPNDVAT